MHVMPWTVLSVPRADERSEAYYVSVHIKHRFAGDTSRAILSVAGHDVGRLGGVGELGSMDRCSRCTPNK